MKNVYRRNSHGHHGSKRREYYLEYWLSIGNYRVLLSQTRTRTPCNWRTTRDFAFCNPVEHTRSNSSLSEQSDKRSVSIESRCLRASLETQNTENRGRQSQRSALWTLIRKPAVVLNILLVTQLKTSWTNNVRHCGYLHGEQLVLWPLPTKNYNYFKRSTYAPHPLKEEEKEGIIRFSEYIFLLLKPPRWPCG